MPKITNHGSPNPLKCPRCGEYRFLVIKEDTFEKPLNKCIVLEIPFFECKNCGYSETVQPKEQILESAEKILEEVKDNEFLRIPLKFKGEKFPPYDKLGFKYDSRDYYCIPGLYRLWDDGFLTPVFFNIDLLLYYNNHNDYKVELSSFSGGTIRKGDKELIRYGFGINRNGKLFAWLGDLYEALSKKENKEHHYRFLAANIESDHDVVSDYYFSQIEANFTESDNENKIFVLKNKFEDIIERRFQIRLSKPNIDNLGEEYKHPLINERNQIFNAYIKLNSFILETTQTKELKRILKNKGVSSEALKGLGSLKLLEMFFKKILGFGDASNLIIPLFVLYDLRLLAGHLKDSDFEEKYNYCKERLGCAKTINHIGFFKQVITSIIEMYKELNKRLERED